MTVKSIPGGFERWSDAELLARKRIKLRPDLPTVMGLSSRSLAMEQYRKLALRIEEKARRADKGSFVLTITSPDAGVGKAMTSLNLGLTLAGRSAGSVLLADGDLWRPRLQSCFGAPYPEVGLRQVLQGDASLDDALVPVEGAGLQVVTAGGDGQADEGLSGTRLEDTIAEMRARCPLVVFDSSPVPLIAISQSLVSNSDGVLLVVGAGKSKKKEIEEALTLIGPDKVIGMVLNRVRIYKMNRHYYEFKE